MWVRGVTYHRYVPEADATRRAARSSMRLANLCIVGWLGLQLVVPFVLKFDLRTGEYHYSRWAWAMFSRLPLEYEVELYRESAAGAREPWPDLDDIWRGVQTGRRVDTRYASRSEVEDRFAALVAHVARERRDGWTYVAELRWTENGSPGHPPLWTSRVHAEPRW